MNTSLHVATTAALAITPETHTVYQGLLREGSTSGREVWRCQHEHPARPGARACARGELAQRALPAPPEMRGTWPGTTQRIRDWEAPDGYRQVPVCPMCNKGLMHTQAEHQQLDPFSRNHQGAST